MLLTCTAACAAKLSAAAAAVARLSPKALEAGVADLASSPADAPDVLQSLVAWLRRCHALLAAGAGELASDTRLDAAIQVGCACIGGAWQARPQAGDDLGRYNIYF